MLEKSELDNTELLQRTQRPTLSLYYIMLLLLNYPTLPFIWSLHLDIGDFASRRFGANMLRRIAISAQLNKTHHSLRAGVISSYAEHTRSRKLVFHSYLCKGFPAAYYQATNDFKHMA